MNFRSAGQSLVLDDGQTTAVTPMPPQPPPGAFPSLLRPFDQKEYEANKDLPNMPQYIPQLTNAHYAAIVVPTLVLLYVYLKQKEHGSRDEQEEASLTDTIRTLLAVGMVGAGAVAACHLQIIPIRVVRKVFPRFQTGPPMSKPARFFIAMAFVLFVMLPTMRFFRTPAVQIRTPQVHRLSLVDIVTK